MGIEELELESSFISTINERTKGIVYYSVSYLKSYGSDDAVVIMKSEEDEGPSIMSIKSKILKTYDEVNLTEDLYLKFLEGVVRGNKF